MLSLLDFMYRICHKLFGVCLLWMIHRKDMPSQQQNEVRVLWSNEIWGVRSAALWMDEDHMNGVRSYVGSVCNKAKVTIVSTTLEHWSAEY